MKAGFVRAMTDALKGKDEHIYHHGSRVSRFVASLGRSMGLSEESCSELFVAGSLHDIGIIATSAGMPVNVDGPTAEYLVAMQENCQRGTQMLSAVPELRDIADILRFHHENFDGSGSPRGLIGEQIPLTCRILRVGDEYDLMTNPRPPATALSAEEAISNLKSRCGKEFDPAIVSAFVKLVRQPEIKQEDLTEDFLANDLPVYAMN
jgi:HD-GYP domain-containing protein (c-di-GMP phosphodiesterase class II)